MKVRKYTVHKLETVDRFPVSKEDMLRYDGAFVNRKYPNCILIPHWYTIRCHVTVARWKTFGYAVNEKGFVLAPSDIKSREWFTYVTGLRSVTLADCLKAKNWMEV